METMTSLLANTVRQSLGEHFSINVKQDVFEFLITRCTEYDCIRQLVEHQVTSTTRCKSGDYTKKITSDNLVVSIPINNLKKRSYNLNDILNVTFSHWYDSDNGSCEQYTELILTKDICSYYSFTIIFITR